MAPISVLYIPGTSAKSDVNVANLGAYGRSQAVANANQARLLVMSAALSQNAVARDIIGRESLLTRREGQLKDLEDQLAQYYGEFGSVLNDKALDFLNEMANVNVPTVTSILAGFENARASRADMETKRIESLQKLMEMDTKLQQERMALRAEQINNEQLVGQTQLKALTDLYGSTAAANTEMFKMLPHSGERVNDPQAQMLHSPGIHDTQINPHIIQDRGSYGSRKGDDMRAFLQNPAMPGTVTETPQESTTGKTAWVRPGNFILSEYLPKQDSMAANQHLVALSHLQDQKNNIVSRLNDPNIVTGLSDIEILKRHDPSFLKLGETLGQMRTTILGDPNLRADFIAAVGGNQDNNVSGFLRDFDFKNPDDIARGLEIVYGKLIPHSRKMRNTAAGINAAKEGANPETTPSAVTRQQGSLSNIQENIDALKREQGAQPAAQPATKEETGNVLEQSSEDTNVAYFNQLPATTVGYDKGTNTGIPERRLAGGTSVFEPIEPGTTTSSGIYFPTDEEFFAFDQSAPPDKYANVALAAETIPTTPGKNNEGLTVGQQNARAFTRQMQQMFEDAQQPQQPQQSQQSQQSQQPQQPQQLDRMQPQPAAAQPAAAQPAAAQPAAAQPAAAQPVGFLRRTREYLGNAAEGAGMAMKDALNWAFPSGKSDEELRQEYIQRTNQENAYRQYQEEERRRSILRRNQNEQNIPDNVIDRMNTNSDNFYPETMEVALGNRTIEELDPRNYPYEFNYREDPRLLFGESFNTSSIDLVQPVQSAQPATQSATSLEGTQQQTENNKEIQTITAEDYKVPVNPEYPLEDVPADEKTVVPFVEEDVYGPGIPNITQGSKASPVTEESVTRTEDIPNITAGEYKVPVNPNATLYEEGPQTQVDIGELQVERPWYDLDVSSVYQVGMGTSDIQAPVRVAAGRMPGDNRIIRLTDGYGNFYDVPASMLGSTQSDGRFAQPAQPAQPAQRRHWSVLNAEDAALREAGGINLDKVNALFDNMVNGMTPLNSAIYQPSASANPDTSSQMIDAGWQTNRIIPAQIYDARDPSKSINVNPVLGGSSDGAVISNSTGNVPTSKNIIVDKGVNFTNINDELKKRANALADLLDEEFGMKLYVSSGFRTKAEQAALIEKGTGYMTAQPGRSPHQFGRAFDVHINSRMKPQFMKNEKARKMFNNDFNAFWAYMLKRVGLHRFSPTGDPPHHSLPPGTTYQGSSGYKKKSRTK